MFKLILIVALVVSHANGDTTLAPDTTPQEIDNAQHLLQELRVKVDAAINYTVHKLEHLGAIATDKGKLLIQEAYAQVLVALNDTKLEAVAAGKDVKVCVDKTEKEIEHFPEIILIEFTSCITDKIKQALGLVKSSIDAVTYTVNDLATVQQKLADCGSGVRAVFCLYKVKARISLDIVELPAKITVNVADGIELVTTFRQYLEQCEIDKTNKVTDIGLEMVRRFAECVTKLK